MRYMKYNMFRSARGGRPKSRWTDPHPSLSAACVGETVIPASEYQDIADNAPGTTTLEGDQPVRTHSIPRLKDAYHCKLFKPTTHPSPPLLPTLTLTSRPWSPSEPGEPCNPREPCNTKWLLQLINTFQQSLSNKTLSVFNSALPFPQEDQCRLADQQILPGPKKKEIPAKRAKS